MRTIMSKSLQDTSFSFSRRYFFNLKKKGDGDFNEDNNQNDNNDSFQDLEIIKPCSSKSNLPTLTKNRKKKMYVSKFTSFFTKSRSGNDETTLGTKVVGTLFGYRRGHVHIAFQENSETAPAFLIELSTPTSGLVREMASGLVRVALECDKKLENKGVKLLEEPLWRAYCNGKKCGYAMRKECGPHEWRVLRSVGPITMGAGVLPSNGGGGGGGGGVDNKVKEGEGELMYMRAKFEKIVGSKDSEAFYMMNPDSSGGPEFSVYLLRV